MAPSRRPAAGSAAGNGDSTGPPLYFSLVYADNQTAVFNIACQKEHLVAAIRRRCRLDRRVTIELWSQTKSRLLNLPDKSDQDCLNDAIQSRDQLVLCKLEDSKFPGIEPRLVPLVKELLDFPALKQLAGSIDQRVSELEAKAAQKLQQSALRKSGGGGSLHSSRLHRSDDAAPSGLAKGRMAIKRIMIINKMTKRS